MQIINPEYWINDKEYVNEKPIFLSDRFSTPFVRASFNKEKKSFDTMEES